MHARGIGMKTTKGFNSRLQVISIVVIIIGSIALVYFRNLNRQQNVQETAKMQTDEATTQIEGYTTFSAGVEGRLDGTYTDLTEIHAGVADLLDIDFTAKASTGQGALAQESEYANLAIAKVDNYVNVRSNPTTDSEVVGKMYDGSVAQILSTAGENKEWFQVVSGTVEGYIKAEYFIYGEDAAAVVDNYVTRYVVVKADRLNVREKPDTSSNRIGYIDNGERAKLLEWGDEWSKVSYTGEHTGYVASEYVTIAEEFIYAKSIEEEQAELAALQELQARTQTTEEAVPERAVVSVPPPQTNYATVSELRTAVVDYAMQYLGSRYVHGGQSLATGTDCSGFTCYVYAEFGYSLSRTPQGQYTSAGRSISMDQIQPGDVICYSSNGSTCTHVGLYIGNGQIIHAANSRKGVIISQYDYDGVILGVRSIVD